LFIRASPEWSLTEAAEAAGVSERTCSKWVGRYRAEGSRLEPPEPPNRYERKRRAKRSALHRRARR
jgi:transposase